MAITFDQRSYGACRLTTTSGQGAGTAVSPPPGHLRFPYTDAFERNAPGDSG